MVKLGGHSIVDKARSFARILASTRELQRFYYVTEILRQDKEASALLRQFTKTQQEVQELRRRGADVNGDLAAEVQRIQREIATNAVIVDWDQGRAEAIGLIQAAGQVVSNAAGVDLSQSPPRSGCGH